MNEINISIFLTFFKVKNDSKVFKLYNDIVLV
jgi:hypothetical protein